MIATVLMTISRIEAQLPEEESIRRLVRTHRPGFYPGLDERARFLLRAGSRLPAVSGRPGPADQMVLADMLDECFQRPVSIVRGILDLSADLAERLAFPAHFARCEVPDRVSGDAAGIEVGLLVADGAAHGGEAKTIRAALDGRLVKPADVALARIVAGRVAVEAAWMSQNLAKLGKQRRRSGRRVADRCKALRAREMIRRAVRDGVCGEYAHRQTHDRNDELNPQVELHLRLPSAKVRRCHRIMSPGSAPDPPGSRRARPRDT